jgi:hypothetical protein
MHVVRSVCLLAILATLAHGPAAAEAPAIRALAVTGQSAPGGGMFERFSVDAQPIVAPVNGRGQVAFFAALSRSAASEGLFLAAGGRITKVALEGDPVPGGGAISGLGRHPVPSLNESGTVAFAAAVAGGKTVEGIFTSARGRLQAVALAGTQAPGIPSGTFASLDAPSLNDRGDVAFLASVRRGRETIDAIYLRAAGKLHKVVAQGDPAPSGGTFAAFGFPTLNNRGAVAFGAVVEGPAVPGGVFVSDGGAIRMVVGAGEPVPIGGIFAKFSERIAFNDAGVLAFHAILKNAPVAMGVFIVDGGRMRMVAAIGDGAPGGGTFSHFGLWPAIDAAGALGFAASVDGGPDRVGLYVTGSTSARRLAVVGDPAPGGGRLATFTLYPSLAMARSGAVTFAAATSAPSGSAEGIYLIAAP